MLISHEWIWNGKIPPPQLDEIDDPGIKKDLGIIVPEKALEVPAETEGPTQVSTPETEG